MGTPRFAPLYETEHCWRLTDLLDESWDYSSLQNTDGSNTPRTYKCNSKQQLARKIFLEFLSLVLDDMIRTGDHYKLPVMQGAKWRIVAKSVGAMRSIVRRGAYQCVNLRLSGNKIYEMVFDYRRGKNWKRAIMQLDATRYGRLCELVEEHDMVYDQN